MGFRDTVIAGVLAGSFAFVAGCGAAGDTGHQAAAKYIGPFQGVLEVTFAGSVFSGDNCTKAIDLAQKIYDQEKDARLALKPDVEKYREDSGFKEKFEFANKMTQQEGFTKFAEKCPEESKTFATLVENMGDELGLGDSAPPFPPGK